MQTKPAILRRIEMFEDDMESLGGDDQDFLSSIVDRLNKQILKA